jgi:hypothetical protein
LTKQIRYIEGWRFIFPFIYVFKINLISVLFLALFEYFSFASHLFNWCFLPRNRRSVAILLIALLHHVGNKLVNIECEAFFCNIERRSALLKLTIVINHKLGLKMMNISVAYWPLLIHPQTRKVYWMIFWFRESLQSFCFSEDNLCPLIKSILNDFYYFF